MNNKSSWKAWVDTMPGPGHPKAKLHVHGDITVDGKAKHSLEKAVPQGINPRILILNVTPKPGAGDVETHLEYHEEFDDKDKYTQVTIREVSEVTVDVQQVS